MHAFIGDSDGVGMYFFFMARVMVCTLVVSQCMIKHDKTFMTIMFVPKKLLHKTQTLGHSKVVARNLAAQSFEHV